MERGTWTDDRIDEKMTVIDNAFGMLRDELHGLREDNCEQFGALRDEVRDLRGDFSSFQGRLVQIGFGMVGVLLAAMVALSSHSLTGRRGYAACPSHRRHQPKRRRAGHSHDHGRRGPRQTMMGSPRSSLSTPARFLIRAATVQSRRCGARLDPTAITGALPSGGGPQSP